MGRFPVGVEKTQLYCLRATAPRVDVTAPPLEVRVALLEAAELTRLGDIGPYSLREGRDRLARGDVCYAAWHGGALAHYSWVQRSGVHSIDPADVVCNVRDGELWIYHCRTAAGYRGYGLYPAVLRRIVDDHFQSGFDRAWIYTSRSNDASQRGIEKAGFRLDSTLSAVRVGGWFRRRRGSYFFFGGLRPNTRSQNFGGS